MMLNITQYNNFKYLIKERYTFYKLFRSFAICKAPSFSIMF